MATQRPNLIYILNDHQAWYGHNRENEVGPLRPRFEAFAAEGMEFTNAYCVTPMCGPARRSMLTGLYPHTHGQVHNENDPPYRHEVYLDKLAEEGYRNYYYGKWHAGPGCAYDHHTEGFSMSGYGNPYNTPRYKAYLEAEGLPRAQHMIEKAMQHEAFDNNGYFKKLKEGETYQSEDFWCGEHAVGITTTPKETHEVFFLANMACEKLEELAKSKESGEPFSLRVDFWGPHQPFFPTKEFADLYNPADIKPYPSLNNPLADKPFVVKEEPNRPMGDGKQVITPSPVPLEDWQLMMARCYAHGTMIDAAGGVILDKVKELGLDENTVIIWTTDHGDAIACQGGHFDKGSNMMQEVMRVPLAMCWKDRIQPGQKDGHLAFTCDLPVTMLDAAQTTFSQPVHGSSLLNLALPKEEEPSWRTSLMCETYGHGYGHTQYGRMVVEGTIKYTCFQDDLDELYDLESDPYELTNLAALPQYNKLKEQMRSLLREKQRETGDPVPLEEILPNAM